ncbi:MAG: hypothetical protein L0I76_23555 [Pseudonocardia sp.]|nr:hypothetical protein [Pseudonocardia sp.]
MTWLLTGPTGTGPVVEGHFCRAFAPAGGRVVDVACARCGDGPLLAGDLAAGDEAATAVVHSWLAGTGWRLAGPVCLECVGELSR